jgi:sec-independent protein translocase protein TatB
MFDIGFSELLIIAVVALLVLGPERLPRAARIAGMWVRRARAQWYTVQADLERELAQEEFKRSVGKPLAEIKDALAGQAQDLRRELEATVPTMGPATAPPDDGAFPVPTNVEAATPVEAPDESPHRPA